MRKNNWKTVSSEIVHENPWYKIQKDNVVLPNGENGEYFIVQTGESVFVVPVKNEKIIFVKQYRYVFDEWFLELPGGGVGENEDIKKTAEKELREEIGYNTRDIKDVGTFTPLSGLIQETSHVFVARDLEFIGQELEASEEGAEIVEIEIEEAYNMIEHGEIVDGQTIASLIIAKKYIK